VLITVPVAALLPNPSAVLLMAPLMPPLARELKLDFRPLLILRVLAATSASLLTLVGDPALYIMGTWPSAARLPPCSSATTAA
jgi:Na+/H+ antiporter NhaD/arsenite permease-like protein